MTAIGATVKMAAVLVLVPRLLRVAFFDHFALNYICVCMSVWAFISLKCMHLLVCASICFPSSSIPFDCVFSTFGSWFFFQSPYFKVYMLCIQAILQLFFSFAIQFIGLFHLWFSFALYYQCRWSVRKEPNRSKYLWQMRNKLSHWMRLLLYIRLCVCHVHCASVYDLARCIYACSDIRVHKFMHNAASTSLRHLQNIVIH